MSLLGASVSISNAQTAVPNGGMEEWVDITSTISLQRPEQWWGFDQVLYNMDAAFTMAGFAIESRKQISRSNDRYEGDFAARIMTRDYEGDLGLVPGILANGEISLNLEALISAIMEGESVTDFTNFINIHGGTAIMGHHVDSVSAYVLVPPTNEDTGVMIIMAMQHATIGGIDTLVEIGSGMQVLHPAVGFQRIVVPMNYTDPDNTATDTLRIVFMSSYITDPEGEITDENRIFVDKVERYITEISSIESASIDLGFTLYPNPTNNNIFIKNKLELSDCNLTIANLLGQVILSTPLKNNESPIDINHLKAGLYFYTISNSENNKKQTGKLLVK